MQVKFTNTQLSPGQVAKITGLTVERQRDYRRHGYMPEIEGEKHARYNLLEIARMYFLHSAGERGIAPKAAAEVAEISATGIAFHALAFADAYSGDHFNLITSGVVPDVVWDEADDAAMTEIIETLNRPELSEKLNREHVREVRQLAYLQRTCIQGFVGRIRVLPAEYLIWWADSSEFWTDNVQAAFDDVPYQDKKRAGPITVLSLQSMAHQLVERSQHPFVTVSLVDPAERHNPD